MNKGDEKRAAIVAQQAARELAEREARRAAGLDTGPSKRRNRPSMGGMPGPRRGRPPKMTGGDR